MQEQMRYKARIGGKEYTILAKQTPAHMDAVISLVNQQLDQLELLDPSLSVEDRAILMAVNALSDQIIKEKRIYKLEEALGLQSETLKQDL